MSARLRNVPALARVRLAQTLRGTVSNLVKVKPSAEDPEAPMPGARVRLHCLIDGVHDWQGVSAADGSYSASGLRAGLSYVPVAVDLSGTYECVASGPVLAVADTRVAPLAPVIIGRPYAAELRVLNVAAAITGISVSGTLPTGLSRDGLSLFGDWPTGTQGSYPLTLTVGQGGTSVEVPIDLELVLLPLRIDASDVLSSSLRLDKAITPITYTASGGEGPYTFGTTGTLPSGLSLLDNGDGTATLGGTPDVQASYTFAVRATDARAAISSVPLAVDVALLASYRYWRVNVSANNGGAYLAIAEMQLRGAAGGSAYTGGTASASSEANAYNVASYAFDGNASTKWTASGTTGWLQYDLGATKVVREIAIMGNYASGDQASFAPKNFTIEARDSTGDAWKTLATITNQTGWGAAEMRTWSVSDV